jgi:sulfoxide reductase catalytic subunit YedY
MSRAFASKVLSRDVTPEAVFFDRRRFLTALGLAGISVASSPQEPELLSVPYENDDVFPAARNDGFAVPEAIERKDLTAREVAASHNNFYEFLPGRGGPVWEHVSKYKVEPWKVEVRGECEKPRTFDLDDLLAFDHEERIYHFRCVERWAMNVPWSGVPLSRLLDRVEPTGNATHLRFISANRPEQMPGMRQSAFYPWPYHEALRMDEATNELALVATGIYGKPLLKQHGAPVRIIVPWKYGYKNPKSIVKIELLGGQPKTFWQLQPHEYGFLSNVNPNIPHPRWSQARSYWVDRQSDWFDTPIFNGYGQYVAKLYPDEPREPQAPLHRGQIAR